MSQKPDERGYCKQYISLREPLHRALETLAQMNDRSMSAQVAHLIREEALRVGVKIAGERKRQKEGLQ